MMRLFGVERDGRFGETQWRRVKTVTLHSNFFLRALRVFVVFLNFFCLDLGKILSILRLYIM
jgi:hypothetical protein